mmetsp:Transcript_7863/g.17968  ORF Transcript_7863/g.17968 Transcript_7863/m.17968 type:complete len:83 (-) Transcript_7863:10-258(-)
MTVEERNAGLCSEWKDPGLKVWLRLETNPHSRSVVPRQTATPPERAPLPEDAGRQEMALNGQQAELVWTPDLENHHAEVPGP